jgi:modulator of FtsH protease
MNEMEWSRPYARGVARESAQDKLAFLRKVYGLFTGSLAAAAFGAIVALYAGASVSHVSVPIDDYRSVTIPPLVAFFMNHYIIGFLIPIAAIVGASAVRFKPGVNVAALFGATFVSGLSLGPLLFIAQVLATGGHTLSASPVRDAFLLTVLGFGGLTGYALVTKKDFSFLGGFVSMGLWVLLGAMFLNFFVGGATFGLAIASVGVLLFGAYVLYDTSRLLHGDNRDPVGAALTLYLNFVNLFVFLLRILMSERRD